MGQDVRDRRLKQRREARRAGIDREDQDVDLPDGVDEGQEQHGGRTQEIERHQHLAPRQKMGIGPEQRREQDERDNPQAQRDAEHGAGVIARELVGEQRQAHGHDAGPGERADLGEVEVPVGPIRERRGERASGASHRSSSKPTAIGSKSIHAIIGFVQPKDGYSGNQRQEGPKHLGLRAGMGAWLSPPAGAPCGTSRGGAGRKRPSARRREPAATRNRRPRALRRRAQGWLRRPSCEAPT